MELTARSRHDHDSNVSPNFVKIAIRSAEGPGPQILEPLLLGWMNEQLNVPGSARFSEAGWGNARVRMVDVSERL
jgi:hypothetical protein